VAKDVAKIFEVGKTHKEILSIPVHKGNANQNRTEISPHSCWNGYHQEYKQEQMLARMWGKKEPLYTAGGNVK
jgi:hypothetical protein